MRQSITVSVIQKQKRQKWTAPEDALLFELIMDKHGLNWTAVAEDMPMRTGKQCRERWHNHLSPDVNKSDWTASEDHLLLELHSVFGNSWCEIAKAMPGRTDNAVKNRWNTWLRHQVKETPGEVFSPSALCALEPEEAQINKITSLLRTNQDTLLAALVAEPADAETAGFNAPLDALVGMVRATNRTELHVATNALKLAVSMGA